MSRRFVMATVIPLLRLHGAALAAPCSSAMTLDGPTSLTTPIVRGLEANGVAIGRVGTCPGHTVRARVSSSRSSEGIELHIEDGFGRTSDRVVSDAGTAVSLIESWVVQEDADLLADAPSRDDAATATVAATTGTPAAAAHGLRLYGGVASAVGGDRSIWGGGLAGGCLRLSASCLGAEVFVARDLGLVGDTADSGTTRSAADLLVTAAVPFGTERWLLMPAVGVGAGWMRTHVVPDEPGPPALTTSTFGLRGAISVLAGLAVSSRVMIALEVGGVVAPGARPDSRDGPTATTLPAEPIVSARAALACVVRP